MVDLMKPTEKTHILSKHRPGGAKSDVKVDANLTANLPAELKETQSKQNAHSPERNWTQRFHDCLYCPQRSVPL